jgi:outer membrane protein assembly factor BamB
MQRSVWYRGLVILTFIVVYSNEVARLSKATVLSSGEIFVDSESGGSIYAVNPTSGATTLISTGGLQFDPNHIVLSDQGQIFTAERTKRGTANPGIVRTDPVTGDQTLVASGPLLADPLALAFDQSSDLVVGNSADQLVRVNPQNGTQTLLTTLKGVSSLQDVDVDSNGRIVVLDFGAFNGGGGKIVRYDPATGVQTTISTGLFNPSDLLIRPSGDYVVANRLATEMTQIIEIDPNTGAQNIALTVPSEGWIALQDENTILYADFYDNLSIVRANLLTGQTQTVTNFHFPQNLVGIAIYSPVPEPSTMCLAIIALGLLSKLGCRRLNRKYASVA